MLKKNHDFRQRAQKLLSENTLEENNLPAAVIDLLIQKNLKLISVKLSITSKRTSLLPMAAAMCFM